MEWLQAQLERNKHTQKNIENYHKVYFLSIQRQKNRNKPLFSLRTHNKQHLRLKTSNNDKIYHNFNMQKTRRVDTKEKENIQEEGRKNSYKVNNLYVAGN